MQTILTLPEQLINAVSRILSRSDMRSLAGRAEELHKRYMNPVPGEMSTIIRKPEDVLTYLALRFPSTYIQISSALQAVRERIPNWQPKSVLDIGCGPATGLLAAGTVFPTLTKATGVDQIGYFLTVGEELLYEMKSPLRTTFVKDTIPQWINSTETEKYDLIIVSSVMNELPGLQKTELLDKLKRISSGVIIIIEPGTTNGVMLIERFAKAFSGSIPLLAPYIDNSFVQDESIWIHFAKRFQRPPFLRQLRQAMRESTLMASDIESTTFAYVAVGSVPDMKPLWAVTIGEVEKYKGYLLVPLLTRDGILKARILKRHKAEYNAAKEIGWGTLLETPLPVS